MRGVTNRSAPASTGQGRAWRSEDRNCWRMAWVLGSTELISWGVLVYTFSVFLPFMERGLGAQQAQLTGAYSLSVLIRGVAAVGVGWWVDRHGVRLLMSVGSGLAALALLAWARVDSLPALYAVFALIGLVSAMVLYEPAFAAIIHWFDARRADALLVVTVLGGLASPVFLPLSAALITHLGWREALVVLAMLAAAITLPLHAAFVRDRPRGDRSSGAGPGRDGGAALTLAAVLRLRPFLWLSAGAVLVAWTQFTISVHLVTYLLERGYRAQVAATVAGLLGVFGVVGRVVLTRVARHAGLAPLTALFMLGQALALLVLLAVPRLPGVALFVVLCGSAFGVTVVSRAALIGEYVPVASYARYAGLQLAAMTVAQVAAPVVDSLLRGLSGGYTVVLLVAAACSTAAAGCLLAAARSAARRRTAPS